MSIKPLCATSGATAFRFQPYFIADNLCPYHFYPVTGPFPILSTSSLILTGLQDVTVSLMGNDIQL